MGPTLPPEESTNKGITPGQVLAAMRLPLAAVAAFLLMSGCLETSADPRPGAAPDDLAGAEGATHTETRSLLLLQPVGASAGPAPATRGSAVFDVPGGIQAIAVQAAWSCVSLCPMHLELVAPDGTVAAEGSGGYKAELSAEVDEAGSWTLRWSPRDGANVGIYGDATVTLTVAD